MLRRRSRATSAAARTIASPSSGTSSWPLGPRAAPGRGLRLPRAEPSAEARAGRLPHSNAAVRAGVPVLRDAASSDTFVDLGMSPLCETLPAPRAAQPDGAVLPAACLGLRAVLPRPAPGVRVARPRSSPSTRTSRPTRLLAGARARLHGHDDRRASASTAARGSSRSPSNDGYLLQYFVAKGIPVLGVEPAANVAEGRRRAGACRRSSVLRRGDRRRARRATRGRPT